MEPRETSVEEGEGTETEVGGKSNDSGKEGGIQFVGMGNEEGLREARDRE